MNWLGGQLNQVRSNKNEISISSKQKVYFARSKQNRLSRQCRSHSSGHERHGDKVELLGDGYLSGKQGHAVQQILDSCEALGPKVRQLASLRLRPENSLPSQSLSDVIGTCCDTRPGSEVESLTLDSIARKRQELLQRTEWLDLKPLKSLRMHFSPFQEKDMVGRRRKLSEEQFKEQRGSKKRKQDNITYHELERKYLDGRFAALQEDDMSIRIGTFGGMGTAFLPLSQSTRTPYMKQPGFSNRRLSSRSEDTMLLDAEVLNNEHGGTLQPQEDETARLKPDVPEQGRGTPSYRWTGSIRRSLETHAVVTAKSDNEDAILRTEAKEPDNDLSAGIFIKPIHTPLINGKAGHVVYPTSPKTFPSPNNWSYTLQPLSRSVDTAQHKEEIETEASVSARRFAGAFETLGWSSSSNLFNTETPIRQGREKVEPIANMRSTPPTLHPTVNKTQLATTSYIEGEMPIRGDPSTEHSTKGALFRPTREEQNEFWYKFVHGDNTSGGQEDDSYGAVGEARDRLFASSKSSLYVNLSAGSDRAALVHSRVDDEDTVAAQAGSSAPPAPSVSPSGLGTIRTDLATRYSSPRSLAESSLRHIPFRRRERSQQYEHR